MSAFQEMVERDLSIFLNPDEFGEIHRFGFGDGSEDRDLLAVIESGTQAAGLQQYGLGLTTCFAYIRASDLPEPRLPGSLLFLDGRPFYVASWRYDLGMAVITLEENSGMEE